MLSGPQPMCRSTILKAVIAHLSAVPLATRRKWWKYSGILESFCSLLLACCPSLSILVHHRERLMQLWLEQVSSCLCKTSRKLKEINRKLLSRGLSGLWIIMQQHISTYCAGSHRDTVCWRNHSHHSSGCWVKGLFCHCFPLQRPRFSSYTHVAC